MNKKNLIKRLLLCAMLIVVVLALTGCGCKHEDTQIVNAVAATCTEKGYTGDTFCNSCNKIIVKGEATDETGHTAGLPSGARSASCDEEGYTGDTFCVDCGVQMETGTILPTTAHTLSETLYREKKATCTREGYTGDIVCIVCGEVVTAGESIPMEEHVPSENRVRVVEATCTREGYTGDIVCVNCNEILEAGEATPMIDHTPFEERSGAYEATCSYEGYTGDLYCSACRALLEEGESIAMVEHTPSEERSGAYEATCTDEGYTGDLYCSECWALLEEGETIEALGHSFGEAADVVETTCTYAGYTGDLTCTVCGYVEYGSVVEKRDHEYDNHICTACQYPESGLYIESEFIYTWDQLISSGYVSVYEDYNGNLGLSDVMDGLYGTLVIDDSITYFRNSYLLKGSSVEEIYLPYSCTTISDSAFKQSTNLEKVHIFAPDVVLRYAAFSECTKLTTVEFVNGVSDFDGYDFYKCEALESFEVPEGIISLPYNFLDCCYNLTSVTLPSTLTTIEGYALASCTSLTAVEIPETVTEIGNNAFAWSALTSIDLSKLQLETLSAETFRGCVSLTEVILPDTLVNIKYEAFRDCSALNKIDFPATLVFIDRDVFRGCLALSELILPESLTTFTTSGYYTDQQWNSLTKIQWPASLLDGSAFIHAVNLKEVHYTGSELQWSMVDHSSINEESVIVYFDEYLNKVAPYEYVSIDYESNMCVPCWDEDKDYSGSDVFKLGDLKVKGSTVWNTGEHFSRGTGFAICEASPSKNFRFGVVPFTVTLTVPAHTTMHMVLNSEMSIVKTADSGSALAYVRFGTNGEEAMGADFEFHTGKVNREEDPTLLHWAYTDKANEPYECTYSNVYTVRNKSDEEQTHVYYFYAMGGNYWASTYEHQFEARVSIMPQVFIESNEKWQDFEEGELTEDPLFDPAYQRSANNQAELTPEPTAEPTPEPTAEPKPEPTEEAKSTGSFLDSFGLGGKK